jgi:hypothetical protein
MYTVVIIKDYGDDGCNITLALYYNNDFIEKVSYSWEDYDRQDKIQSLVEMISRNNIELNNLQYKECEFYYLTEMIDINKIEEED